MTQPANQVPFHRPPSLNPELPGAVHELAGGALYLTPEELIAFIEQELASVDDSIRRQMQAIKAKRDQVEALQHTIARLNAIKSSQDNTIGPNPDSTENKKLIDSLRDDPIAARDVEADAVLEDIAAKIEAGKIVDVESTIQELEGRLSNLTSSTDLEMIRLQKDIEARQRMVMFVTNTLKAMDESADRVVGNIG
jgi:hypothetical protein